MTSLRLLSAWAVAVSVGCGSTVSDGPDGDGAGAAGAGGAAAAAGGAGGAGGAGPEPTYPLVVQYADDGYRRLTFATDTPLSCSLSDPYPVELFGCGRFVISAAVPEAKLYTGAILENDVDGVAIFSVDSAPPETPNGMVCATGAGPLLGGGQIELLDVSDTVTARLLGITPYHYEGTVDGTYTGGNCPPGPGPQPGTGTARVWGTDSISLVVSSEPIDCTPDPQAPTACETWQLELTFPGSLLVPGPLDLGNPSVFSSIVGHGALHDPPQSPTDCPTLLGGGIGSVVIDAVSDTEVHLTLDDFNDGVAVLDLDGIYVAPRCP